MWPEAETQGSWGRLTAVEPKRTFYGDAQMYRYFKLVAGLVSAFFVGVLSFSPPHEAYASIAGAVRFIAVLVALVTAALTIWDFLKSRPDA